MYKLLFDNFETDEITEVQSPVIPFFRQSVTYFDKNSCQVKADVRFVDYVFNETGDFQHIIISVTDDIDDEYNVK